MSRADAACELACNVASSVASSLLSSRTGHASAQLVVRSRGRGSARSDRAWEMVSGVASWATAPPLVGCAGRVWVLRWSLAGHVWLLVLGTRWVLLGGGELPMTRDSTLDVRVDRRIVSVQG
jgi:hypothetical protein